MPADNAPSPDRPAASQTLPRSKAPLPPHPPTCQKSSIPPPVNRTVRAAQPPPPSLRYRRQNKSSLLNDRCIRRVGGSGHRRASFAVFDLHHRHRHAIVATHKHRALPPFHLPLAARRSDHPGQFRFRLFLSLGPHRFLRVPDRLSDEDATADNKLGLLMADDLDNLVLEGWNSRFVGRNGWLRRPSS